MATLDAFLPTIRKHISGPLASTKMFVLIYHWLIEP